VPRPIDKWLTAIFTEKSWRNRNRHELWFKKVKELVTDWGCVLRHDPRWHWRESVYVSDYEERGPHILVGGGGSPAYVCTAILHELGHRIAHAQGQMPNDVLANEEVAWQHVIRLSQEHQLPFASSLKREALYSYRYARLRAENSGSKRQNRRTTRYTTERIGESKRTKLRSQIPLGKKGRKKYKKEQKQRSNRTERRRRRQGDGDG